MQGSVEPKRQHVTWGVVTEEVLSHWQHAHRASSRAGETEAQELCLWCQIVWVPGGCPQGVWHSLRGTLQAPGPSLHPKRGSQ